MQRISKTLVTLEQLKSNTAEVSINELKIGEDVDLWIKNPQGKLQTIPCIIAGFSTLYEDTVHFFVGFQVEGTSLYVVAEAGDGILSKKDQSIPVVVADRIQELFDQGMDIQAAMQVIGAEASELLKGPNFIKELGYSHTPSPAQEAPPFTKKSHLALVSSTPEPLVALPPAELMEPLKTVD